MELENKVQESEELQEMLELREKINPEEDGKRHDYVLLTVEIQKLKERIYREWKDEQDREEKRKAEERRQKREELLAWLTFAGTVITSLVAGGVTVAVNAQNNRQRRENLEYVTSVECRDSYRTLSGKSAVNDAIKK